MIRILPPSGREVCGRVYYAFVIKLNFSIIFCEGYPFSWSKGPPCAVVNKDYSVYFILPVILFYLKRMLRFIPTAVFEDRFFVVIGRFIFFFDYSLSTACDCFPS